MARRSREEIQANHEAVLLDKERSFMVAKSNELITRSRYALSLQEQKALLYLISKIKPDDRPGTMYTLQVAEFCRVCGFDMREGYYYREVREALQKLANVSAWIDLGGGRKVLFRWLDYVEVDDRGGTFRASFHRTVAPYLYSLTRNYTQYSIFSILAMSCKYSPRLYELMLALKYRRKFTLQLDELKILLSAEDYSKYSHFRARVLDPAYTEVNDLTDISITYKAVKTGHAVSGIEFEVADKRGEQYAFSVRMVDALLDQHRTLRKKTRDPAKIMKEAGTTSEGVRAIHEAMEEYNLLEDELQVLESIGLKGLKGGVDKELANQLDEIRDQVDQVISKE